VASGQGPALGPTKPPGFSPSPRPSAPSSLPSLGPTCGPGSPVARCPPPISFFGWQPGPTPLSLTLGTHRALPVFFLPSVTEPDSNTKSQIIGISWDWANPSPIKLPTGSPCVGFHFRRKNQTLAIVFSWGLDLTETELFLHHGELSLSSLRPNQARRWARCKLLLRPVHCFRFLVLSFTETTNSGELGSPSQGAAVLDLSPVAGRPVSPSRCSLSRKIGNQWLNSEDTPSG